MVTPELLAYIKSQRDKGITEDIVKDNLIRSGWKLEDYNQVVNQNTTILPLSRRKPNIFIKIYVALGVFILLGFIVFMIKMLLSNSGNMFIENSPWNNTINTFLEIWGIVFAYILPLGIINFGLWSILYKESGIEKPEATKIGDTVRYLTHRSNILDTVVAFQGNRAIIAGIFYLILGLFICWGVTGVLLGIICKSPMCASLPKFIKFF